MIHFSIINASVNIWINQKPETSKQTLNYDYKGDPKQRRDVVDEKLPPKITDGL